MHVDLITLYALAIGTLLVSCGMTFWEHHTNAGRSRELKILAAGYGTLAIGCAAASFRHAVPGVWGSALSNLVIEAGYLLILHGVAALSGRRYRAFSIGLLAVQALAWAIGGVRGQETVWSYASALSIAAVAAMTSRELLRSDRMHWGQARRITLIVCGAHALLYAARACILPWMAALGTPLLMMIAKITMYEGVLYSVLLPMTLLRLVRDEAHAQLLQQSQTDYLTGLGNRRSFFEEGGRTAAGREVSVLAIDLDHFKTINDRYGHQAGDEVLKSFANIARTVLGPDAILARIGGEEFAAVLAGPHSGRAKELAQHVVERFAAATSRGANGAELRATVSIGLAQSGTPASALADVLGAADRALYAAKAGGGNRVEVGRLAECAVAA
ncbi:Diguanylate cyclase (GGDEF) domain-containing protein [Burkholderia sp. 8Y]|uniref:GGDEF domain-containing protein n=1 Tax=Burkholderia sp. 8Y TaxID=2653133 RepID=UPI0012F161B0|nr:GGDEF domain-containing protein [Burkholderia sp. 8Y]VXB44772.1 Diguanylate cyclase (GGDEF) domain-containing protein [Burkholderia sp. 8Y]